MNPKLQKTISEIEQTKAKISALQALLPELEKKKTELENAEIIKVFRTVNVTPGEFAAFVAAYKAGVLPTAELNPKTPKSITEETQNDSY
ncbi:MAG: DUF4315 family protein [Oscillospiraceae bacterium]|jgi:hypothetical protein|nr:DUF4315 family protein [Oscillospiraceae bacterium]